MSDERIAAAVGRITKWLRGHRGGAIADNLAPGASAEAIAEVEAAFGVALPPGLRALWSLHDGQRKEGDCFVERLGLFSARQAIAEARFIRSGLGFFRNEGRRDVEASDEELASDAWIPIAGRDLDFFAVSGVTGRVFAITRSLHPFRRIAASVEEWLEGYADRIEASDYRVTSSGSGLYLEERDREEEQRNAERAAARKLEAAEKKKRAKLSMADQARAAIGDPSRWGEVLDNARNDAALAEVATIFAEHGTPALLAEVLRPYLNRLTLSPDVWAAIAIGGAELENNAVRDAAMRKSKGVSDARIEALRAYVEAPERKYAGARAAAALAALIAAR